MSDEQFNKPGRRSLHNAGYNSRDVENNQNDIPNINPNYPENNQINQNYQSPLNAQVNLDSPPIPNSREVLTQNQVHPFQAQNMVNNNINPNFQPVPIQSSQRVNYQLPYNIVVVQSPVVVPRIITVKTRMPFNMICPYCQVQITTEPETTCNVGVCCTVWWLSFMFTPLVYCIYCCIAEDCCCYNAIHRCPICKRPVAQKLL